jgi:hypothetical protein
MGCRVQEGMREGEIYWQAVQLELECDVTLFNVSRLGHGLGQTRKSQGPDILGLIVIRQDSSIHHEHIINMSQNPFSFV